MVENDASRGHRKAWFQGENMKLRLNSNRAIHGRSKTPEYNVWIKIKQRCFNKNGKDYPDYGGRGITVCDRWLTFENFFSDMGERPSPTYSIDRINNDGNYEPRNCRWATPNQQARNRRVRKLDSYPKGEQHGSSKISTKTVIKIRNVRKSSSLTYVELADRFKISKSQAHRLCMGQSWSWLS